MTYLKLLLTCLLIVVQTCPIYGQNTAKSSLTFVIDDTGSMYSEINEVIKNIDVIFESAMRAKDSQIENIVLVTFNDPDVILRTITKDLNKLKNALAQINVHGGQDCPEYALTGIHLALENSMPYSSVFVFTDASAIDYMRYEEIKNLAVMKNIRLFFILTGYCSSTSAEDYQVYYNLAMTTGGNVFEVLKKNIKDIIPYVMVNILALKPTIAPVAIPQVYSKKFKFTVRNEAVSLVIIVRGRDRRVAVFDPEGKPLQLDRITDLDEVLGVQVVGSKPGVYWANVTATSEINLQVFGNATPDFFKDPY